MPTIVPAQPGFFIVTPADDAVSSLVRDPVIGWALFADGAVPIGIKSTPDADQYVIQYPDGTYDGFPDGPAVIEHFKARAKDYADHDGAIALAVAAQEAAAAAQAQLDPIKTTAAP